MPLSVSCALPYQEMQMRHGCITGVAAEADELPLLDGIAHIYISAIGCQVPIACARTVIVLNDDHVAIEAILAVHAAACAIFFYAHHDATSCRVYFRAFHIEIDGRTFFVRHGGKIALYHTVALAGRKRKRIDITGVVFDPAFLQAAEGAALRIFANCTTNE